MLVAITDSPTFSPAKLLTDQFIKVFPASILRYTVYKQAVFSQIVQSTDFSCMLATYFIYHFHSIWFGEQVNVVTFSNGTIIESVSIFALNLLP